MDEESILVKAYLIDKKPELINAHIELHNIISLRDYDPKPRIMVDKISLVFSSEVTRVARERIKEFFRQITKDTRLIHTKNYLTMNFGIEKPDFIKGQVFQQDSTRTIPLYTIHISSPCITNEQ
jgi:hypothetical protein